MVPKIKQLNTLEDKVDQGNVRVVLLNSIAIVKRNTLPKPPPINTNR